MSYRMSVHAGNAWFTQSWRALRHRAGPHRLPLLFVLCACCIGQAAVLIQSPLVSFVGDGRNYLLIATHILASGQFTDPLRTPGYPAFMALLFVLTGGIHLEAVVVAQVVLTIAATIGVYVLAIRMGLARWTATVVAALVGANPYTINFERNILTESLSFFLIVLLFLLFERYVRFGRLRTLIWLSVLCVYSILTRPIFIFLPVLFGVALLWFWARANTGTLRAHWRSGLAALCLIYGLLAVYAGLNGITTGYLGLSDITDFNLCGKLLEYRMYDLPIPHPTPRQAQLQSGLHAYMRVSGRNPWDYINQYPEYEAGDWQIPASLMKAEIQAHPGYYLQQTAHDIVVCFYVAPFLYVNYFAFYTPTWIAILLAFFTFASRLYALLPLVVLAQAVRSWRHPRDIPRLVLFVALAALTADILITAISDDTDFWRLRFPFDWVATLALAASFVDLVRALARGLAHVRRDKAAERRHQTAGST